MHTAAINNDIAPLACHQLHKSYEGTMVLNGLSLSVPQGAVMGLIGRNGAGKSTLIRILLGLTQPASGQSSLFGEPSLHLSDKVKARLSYVPQQPDALNWMRVGDMLDFIGSCYPRWDAKYVDDALSRWWISKDKRLSVLSPGERQRVALIRALANQPELLVLDEPASALDPVARRDLLREIAQRAGDVGTTVLFSTHIVSDLERVASHVAFLHAGKLLLNTTMDELKETHARLILTRDALQQVHGLLPGEIVRHTHQDGSARIVLSREPNQSWPAITTHVGATLDVLSLEDLFIEVAG